MITGIHGLFYTSQAAELRAFLRDKLGLPSTDIGDGWLIFDFANGDLGVHPTGDGEAQSGTHNISFFTNDLEATVEELKGRGVEIDGDIADHGYGFVTHIVMPGGLRIQIYQPKYTKGGTSSPKAEKKGKKGKAKKAKAKQAKAEAPKPKKAKPKKKAKDKKSKPKKSKGDRPKGKKKKRK
jgi:predicted enzyme related to lactoylglutathione lyase